MICAMDNPSGSVPATIASTMSGARLFKPSTRVTYGGFKPWSIQEIFPVFVDALRAGTYSTIITIHILDYCL